MCPTDKYKSLSITELYKKTETHWFFTDFLPASADFISFTKVGDFFIASIVLFIFRIITSLFSSNKKDEENKKENLE